MRKEKVLRSILANWRTVVAGLNTLSEREAKWCLEQELNGPCRKVVVERLYGRYNRMRTERELGGYLQQVLDKTG